jgi:hypothetical protein
MLCCTEHVVGCFFVRSSAVRRFCGCKSMLPSRGSSSVDALLHWTRCGLFFLCGAVLYISCAYARLCYLHRGPAVSMLCCTEHTGWCLQCIAAPTHVCVCVCQLWAPKTWKHGLIVLFTQVCAGWRGGHGRRAGQLCVCIRRGCGIVLPPALASRSCWRQSARAGVYMFVSAYIYLRYAWL